jgi:hypothetical protein
MADWCVAISKLYHNVKKTQKVRANKFCAAHRNYFIDASLIIAAVAQDNGAHEREWRNALCA